MANPTLQSPNIGNYYIGTGVVQFKPEGADDYYYVGNCPTFEFSPSIKTLDHFSSMAGIQSKDDSVVLQVGGTIKMQLEELTARNLALFLLGDVDLTDPQQPTIDIFSTNLLAGALKFIATNEVGPRWTFEFNRVEFTPSGKFDPISTTWGNVEVTGSISTSGGSFGTATCTNLEQDAPEAPENLGLPDFYGNLVVDDILTAFEGVWAFDPTSYSYQWQKSDDGVTSWTSAGSTDTESTYTVGVGLVGKYLRVQVTAHNTTGDSGAASSPSQGPVVAAETS